MGEQSETGVGKPAPQAGDSLRVLVVDDYVPAARMLALLLEQIGAEEVKVAFDGEAALQIVESFCPHVVFLDLALPKLDGYELARQLRTRPALWQALFVALSGYCQEDDQRKCAEAGIDLFLAKPASRESLELILKSRRGS